jgi:uncharacterized protein
MKQEIFILDTNIWISYLLSKKYHLLVQLIIENELEIVTCKNLVTEFYQVLRRKKFRKYLKVQDINEAVKIHLKLCKFIQVELKTATLADKKDNYLLDLYREAKATIIVTGDKQLITEAKNLGFNVITLAKFEKSIGMTSDE